MMTPSRPRSALVVTVVHDPRDSRIWFRQIDALLERGWRVTYAAPFSAQTTPPTEHLDGTCLDRLRFVTLPRAQGRHRLRAALGVRRLLRREASHHDVTLLHDPE